jgi:hypothetical protein
MPNAFMYYRKNDETKKPVPFSEIDQEICNFFGAVPDDKYFYYSWYDSIGDLTSQGFSFDEILKHLNKIKKEPRFADELSQEIIEKTAHITKWMMERYNSEAWYASKSI